MEVLNYRDEPVGKSSTIGLFDVYIPALQLTLRKFKLVKTRNGGYMVCSPSFSVESGFDQKEWFPFFEFSKERHREFQEICLHELRQHFR